MQLAAGDLARPLIELGARLRARFAEEARRPALAAGGFAGDRAAGCPVQHQIAGEAKSNSGIMAIPEGNGQRKSQGMPEKA